MSSTLLNQTVTNLKGERDFTDNNLFNAIICPVKWLAHTTRRLLLCLMILLSLLLTGFQVQAEIWTFPGHLPGDCTGPDNSGNYNCSVLTLSDGDTITITTKPATISFSGAFTTGAGTLINVGGNAADLNIILEGVLNVGNVRPAKNWPSIGWVL
jgi:hypothetical protein